MHCLSACYAIIATFRISNKRSEFWRRDFFTIGVMGMLQGKGISSVYILIMAFFESLLAEHHREGPGCSNRFVERHSR